MDERIPTAPITGTFRQIDERTIEQDYQSGYVTLHVRSSFGKELCFAETLCSIIKHKMDLANTIRT